MAESRRSPESLAREAMMLYWRVQSHGFEGAIPQRSAADRDFELASVAQEAFERLSKTKQAEVRKRMRELEELPSEGRCETIRPEVARPAGVPEEIWLMYLTIATHEERLRHLVAHVPWQLLKAVNSEGLVIHPDWPELSPWSVREFGERILGYRATDAEDWPERHTRAMLRTAYRRIGRKLFEDWH